MKTKEPEFQDDVRHKSAEMIGVVIAKYPVRIEEGKTVKYVNHLDVHGVNDKIYYATPAANWITTRTREDKEGTDVKE